MLEQERERRLEAEKRKAMIDRKIQGQKRNEKIESKVEESYKKM